MQVTGPAPARTRLTILEKHFDFQRVPFPNFIGYLVNIFLVDVNLQCVVSRKTRACPSFRHTKVA